MSYAAIRVRGTVKVRKDIKNTLKMLRLNKVNHCVLIPKNDSYEGMLRIVKDYVTWGEIEPRVIAKLLRVRGELIGGKKVTNSYIRKNTEYSSIADIAEAVSKGVPLPSLKGFKPVLRLPPPRKGYEGIKRPYSEGGALGYRGREINNLLMRMISEEEG